MKTAILTVSTSLHAGTGEDLSGPALVDAARAAGCEVTRQDLLPDDRQQLERWLRERVDDGFDLIFTTGGTGFTPDDVTPEATAQVIERPAPGIAEAMRAESLKYTRMAMLSRATAGIAQRTLIVNFPGSPSSIGELFPVIAPLLEHAVRTMNRGHGRRD